MKMHTIGVYNTTEERFFQKLIDARIDLFCDIRMRRGVRGATYAFVNSNRLQEKLKSLDIRYSYLHDLAPTNEIRNIQLTYDKKNNVKQKDRTSLVGGYVNKYRERVLNKFDIESFVKKLEEDNIENIVFFCVEENPNACHRSIVMDAFKENGFEAIDL